MSRTAEIVPAMGASTPPTFRDLSVGWRCVPPDTSFTGEPQALLNSSDTAPGGRDRGRESSHDILGGYMGKRKKTEAVCASCHQSFECLVVHNEATDTHLCRPCDLFWSCSRCHRAYLNDGAILLTGMCSGCASDALTGGE